MHKIDTQLQCRHLGCHSSGYGKRLMPGLSPKNKGEAESVASSPKGVKRVKRHILPPPISRLGRQYESEDEQVPKGPKVIQLLRTVIKLREEHKKLCDEVAELTLELKSVKENA